MIKLIEVYIEEFRGIKKLTLHPKGENFVIHGPNGSGKSGVVDAIDFGLTGDISRLAGKGTRSLSLKAHGPHVDVRDSPNVSLVHLG
jgi:DNA repair exonuclease SbcCD ATPase subunit